MKKPLDNPILSDTTWRVDTPKLLKEIADCSGVSIYRPVLAIFARILTCAVERAVQLDDPILNVCMLKMKLYDVPHNEIENRVEEQISRLDS